LFNVCIVVQRVPGVVAANVAVVVVVVSADAMDAEVVGR
jgi:hypothetical protein